MLPAFWGAGEPTLGTPSEYEEMEAAIVQGQWSMVREVAVRASGKTTYSQELPEIFVHGIRGEAELAAIARLHRDERSALECERHATAL